ncbi:ABC transporter permease [Spiroplasma sp. TIUS-1]|uniref:ABC transporter permease n=1 Tax=Spiroplasma sp. TIUS-1 TaxID=216963 RepID=UPI0013A6D75D|nr:ABC transporter permease [Spiroplasma sp. TIUS-1]
MKRESSSRLINPTKDNKTKLPESQDLYEQYLLNKMAYQNEFEWTKTEEWTINNITNQQKRLKLKVISKFDSVGDNSVDRLVISEGESFSADFEKVKRQVVVNPTFAKNNKLEIGSIIRLQPDEYGTSLLVEENQSVKQDIEQVSSFDELLQNSKYYDLNWYEVIGFGSSIDFAYPTFDSLSLYPKSKQEALVYVHPINLGFQDYKFDIDFDGNSNPRTMKLFNSTAAAISLTSDFDRNSYYSIKFDDPLIRTTDKDLDLNFKKLANLTNNIKYFYNNDDKTYQNYDRVNNVKVVIVSFNFMMSMLMLVILSLALFIFYLVSKREIENELTEIGHLKSMGYKNNKIVFNYLAMISFSTTGGFVVSMLIFLFLENVFLNSLTNIFNFSFGFTNTFMILKIISFVLVIIFFFYLTYIICIINFNKPLTNLNFGIKKTRISFIAIQYKKIFAKRSFDKKLRSALFVTSISKIIGIAFAMLLCSTLMSAVLFIPQQIKNNYNNIFSNIHYKNKVVYSPPVANNPLSFLKTYNPDFKDAKWGFNFENKITQQYIGSKTKQDVSTAYPLDSNNEIDWYKVTNDLIEDNIHTDFYSFDIAPKHNTAWAEFSWLNWKNLSTDFLLNLDNAEIDDSGIIGAAGSGQTMQNIYFQWNDYATLSDNLKQFKKQNPNKQMLIKYNNIMLNFYKKYVDSIPLTYNKKVLNENKFDNVQLNKVIKKGLAIRNKDYEKFWKLDNNYNKFYEIKNSEQPDFNFWKEDELVNVKNIKSSSLSNWSEDEIKHLNNNLTIWFLSVFEWRLGVAIILLSYTNSPYYVQQKIIDSLNEGTNFTISNSIVPYNKNFDELGTSFKVSKNGLNFEINGVEPNSTLNILMNKDYELLNRKLFVDNHKTYDIVINESLANKMNLDIDSLADFEVFNSKLKQLVNNEFKEIDLVNDIKMGWRNNPYKDFRTQSSRSYYSNPKNKNEARNFSDTNVLGIPEEFSSASFGGKDLAITNGSALGASKQPPVHKKVTENELIISNEKGFLDKKFRVVGIEQSYGKPQAWISNENANEIIEYDKVQKFNFENFFIPEWAFVDELYEFDNFADEELQSFLQSNPSYEEFIVNVNNNEKWSNINKLFNNLYPVFNYKLSSNSRIDDLELGLSSTQKFGDYSEFGTRGSYELITPPNCEDQNSEECQPIVNKDSYYEGFSSPTLNTVSPVYLASNIIDSLIIKLNFIIFIFIIILFAITFIILLLSTTLIVQENTEFMKMMKTMGYSNFYLIKQIFSLYNSWILFMFGIGLGLGIFTISSINNQISSSTDYVFYTNIHWMYPILIFIGLLVLYLITFIISWANVKKIIK